MNCPKCKLKLNKTLYEETPIHVCEGCRGTVVEKRRLKMIQVRREKTEADFLDEISVAEMDTLAKIRCPRCRSNMEKRLKKLGSIKFFIDRCGKCSLIWLDEGELAKMQLVFEYSEKGEECERFRQRLLNMTPEEKKELDDRIAKLPEETFSATADDWLGNAVFGNWLWGDD